MKNSLVKVSFISAILLICGFNTVYGAVLTPSDISKHWANNDITNANTEGWAYLESGKFKPDKNATREEVVWMLVGACKSVQVLDFNINKTVNLSTFKDKPSAWAKNRLSIAVANGLIKGYPDNTLHPKAPITRAELAVLLGRKINETVPKSYNCGFYDSLPYWALDDIKKTKTKGIIKGYPDGMFKPNTNVTKAEALVMIKRWKEQQLSLPDFSNLPSEFKTIYNTIYGTCIMNKELVYFTHGKPENNFDLGAIWIEGNESTTMIIVRRRDATTFSSLKQILKVYFPSEYNQAYILVQDYVNNKSKTTDKDIESKKFSCGPNEGAICITIKK